MNIDAHIAVIVPVYKHSVLLTEALDSALCQDLSEKVAVVVVDDGCPFEETQLVGRAYARSCDDVVYLRKENGGLSSARNYGIDYVLRNGPNVEAVYFLDSDNRISRSSLRDGIALLRKNPEIDWIYPNIDKVGIEWHGNYAARYSKLLHITFDNICEAGSLVSRRLLESGIRFDEDMKSGFEDWDFWLQAIAKGFRGMNCPSFGFEYRQRAESMLRASNRERQAILNYLQQKHKALFSLEYLLACEHEEAPRYGVVSWDEERVALFTDPDMPRDEIDLDRFRTEFWASIAEPESFGVPPFICWVERSQANALSRLGLAHDVFWLMERCAETHHFVALQFEQSAQHIEFKLDAVSSAAPLGSSPAAWMTRLSLMTACVLDSSDSWVRSLCTSHPEPTVMRITICAPFTVSEITHSRHSTTDSLLATLGALRNTGYYKPFPGRWSWREAYLPPRSKYYELLRRTVGVSSPIMPRLRREGLRTIGFLLPIAAFGGVERVAYALARVLKAAGYDVHLFVLGRPVYRCLPENDGLFTSINFLAADYPLWGGPHIHYGHELLMGHDDAAQVELVTGLLSGMDVVINCQVASVNAALGELRRRGTKVVGHWHVIDRSETGRSVGHPYLALAFEHVYDLMLTCSRTLADWLHGMGVPRAKLLHIANAPSFALDPAAGMESMSERKAPTNSGIRAVFLGRLDRQKGVERILLAAERCKSVNLPVNWRIIGSEVLEADSSATWRQRFADLGLRVEEPLYDAVEMAKVLAESDVLVLPSRWEGTPLTVLEAQRLGCVPIATKVGAVGEIIEDGVDGVLLDDADDTSVADELISVLKHFLANRDELGALSQAGRDRSRKLDWAQNSAEFLSVLKGWMREFEPEETVAENFR